MKDTSFPALKVIWENESTYESTLSVILEEDEEEEEEGEDVVTVERTSRSGTFNRTYDRTAAIYQSLSSSKVNRGCQRKATIVFILFNCLNFLVGMGYSMQAPFFPKEAEMKGVSSSVYGFIFGVFQFTSFFLSPLYGKYIQVIGARFLLSLGSYVMAVAFVLFGFLDWCAPGMPFIVLCFAVRITEAVGNSAFTTSCYTITAQQFSSTISGSFAYLQTSFAAGMIVGPTFGGYLYEMGGFPLPFFVAGSLVFLMSVVTSCLLPPIDVRQQQSTRSVFALLMRPSVLISCFTLFTIAFSFGFVASILEPHVRQFSLRPSLLGCLFIIDGVVCAFVNRLWGFLAEQKVSLKLLSSIGALLLAAGFVLMGPAPFLPVDPCLWLTCMGLALYGVGIGGEFLVPFLDIIQEVIRCGYPDNTETYGISSGLWSSSTALGEFVGPSVAGLLNDAFGFRQATLFAIALHFFAGLLCIIHYFCELYSPPDDSERQLLLATSTN